MMRTRITSLWATLLVAAAMVSKAEESSTPKPGSPEFERMKTLVGTWQGKTDMGHGPVDFTVQYRVLAAGSVVEERVFADTPNEMVTMYYDQNGKLALTHYCVLGNRPGMRLASSDGKTLRFEFDKSCGIDPAKESHMHGLMIAFDDADTITTACKAIMDGKEQPEHPVTLKRVRASSSVAKKN
jgi:hypothetical protein